MPTSKDNDIYGLAAELIIDVAKNRQPTTATPQPAQTPTPSGDGTTPPTEPIQEPCTRPSPDAKVTSRRAELVASVIEEIQSDFQRARARHDVAARFFEICDEEMSKENRIETAAPQDAHPTAPSEDWTTPLPEPTTPSQPHEPSVLTSKISRTATYGILGTTPPNPTKPPRATTPTEPDLPVPGYVTVNYGLANTARIYRWREPAPGWWLLYASQREAPLATVVRNLNREGVTCAVAGTEENQPSIFTADSVRNGTDQVLAVVLERRKPSQPSPRRSPTATPAKSPRSTPRPPEVNPVVNFDQVAAIFLKDWQAGTLTADEVCFVLQEASIARGTLSTRKKNTPSEETPRP